MADDPTTPGTPGTPGRGDPGGRPADRPEDERPAGPSAGDVLEERDPELEPEMPRRAASAEFLVDAEVGSRAGLREAMDPANQSLREALRLSYRVLQVVIVALVVVFVFSGVTRVEQTQSGVMLRFGAIVGEPGQQALEPGAQFSVLPYPAGEFVIFRDRNREVDLTRDFWPRITAATFDDAVDDAVANQIIRPGPNRDGLGTGYVLTAGGDIAHLQLRATYDVLDPVSFVEAVANAPLVEGDPDTAGLDADRAVKLSVMRAAVHTAAGLDLESLVDFTDQEREDIRRDAEDFLGREGIDTGIRISELSTPTDPVPALAIVRAQRELQQRRQNVERDLENARQLAEATLIEVAGENYRELLNLIDAYETADPTAETPEAESILAEIDALLEDRGKSGQIALFIEQARARRSFIEATLGQQYLAYQELLDSYLRNPELVINREWAQAYARILRPSDTEVIQVPDSLNTFRLMLSGNEEIQRRRRDADLDRAERESMRGFGGSLPFLQGAEGMERQLERRPGRQLDRGATFDG